jgi:hypothetical protein
MFEHYWFVLMCVFVWDDLIIYVGLRVYFLGLWLLITY